MPLKTHLQWKILAFISLVAAILLFVSIKEDRQDILRIVFLDVGQGDSIYIEAPNGNQLLIDGGPSQGLLRSLGKEMSFYDRTIDTILVSNPDKDHFAGFVGVLKSFSVGMEIEPGTRSKASAYVALQMALRAEPLEPLNLKAGDTLFLDRKRGVRLDVLFPDRDVSGLATNDGSIIAKLSYGSVCVIFSGDAPQSVEKYVVSLYRPALDCQILKVGHHGSKTSTSLPYVEAVSPEYAVISSGAGNTYGHPHKETLDTLENAKASVLRTDTIGAITFLTDGRTLIKK